MKSNNEETSGKVLGRKKVGKPYGQPQRGNARPRTGSPASARFNSKSAPKGSPRKKLAPAQFKQAKALVEQSGIPFTAAVRVVLGKTTLNDVLQEMLREEKIKNLIEAHGINRALATNIVLGRTDLEVVLLRRRKNQTLQAYYSQSCLDEALKKNQTLALALHGHEKVIGKVGEVGKYSFLFQEKGQPEPIEIHKTRVKFAYDPDQYRHLRKFMGIDNKIKAMKLEPVIRAKDRYHFKNLSLQHAIDEKLEAEVTTLEGDTLKGQIEWFGRWEFGMKFKGGIRVTVFRHAVYQLKVLEPG